MTTHDHPDHAGYAADADATTVSADPGSERLVGNTTGDASPRTATDPSWQQQADRFAASRNQRGGGHSSSAATDSANSTDTQDTWEPHGDNQSSIETGLFAATELEELRRGWDSLQASFVDDPRHCVEQADGLVFNVVERLSSSFAEARSRLAHQWSRGEDTSTEDLRMALKRYRELFDRLLAV
jgi:hypothetical protein